MLSGSRECPVRVSWYNCINKLGSHMYTCKYVSVNSYAARIPILFVPVWTYVHTYVGVGVCTCILCYDHAYP